MSLRERKKGERRDAILQAAGSLFGEVGFSHATMDEIARRAGVGVATVYKHFGTKSGILDALIQPTLEASYAAAEKIIANPAADPGTAMADLIDTYRHLRNDWSTRRLLRAVSILGIDAEPALQKMVQDSDTHVQGQIRDLLLVLRARGHIDPVLDLDDATAIVFAVFNQHYQWFLINEDMDAERMFAAMRNRIRMLFMRW